MSCDKRQEVAAFGTEETNFEIGMAGNIDDIPRYTFRLQTGSMTVA